ALRFKPDDILIPFLKAVLQSRFKVKFHTPNAINARFVSRKLADLMIEAGFTNIYLGFESSAYVWQKKTGGKVYSGELAMAVDNLIRAGAESRDLHAYIIAGHPLADEQQVEKSIRLASSLGLRVMLSDRSEERRVGKGCIC